MLLIWILTLWHLISGQKQDNPHIVYILIDDLGWANVNYHNPRMITPNIDNLLKESLLLNQFYVFKFCSPSRSALLSGRIPYHVNQKNEPCCARNFGIPLNMTTISERLVQDSGYIAHQIGKWHLGMASLDYLPYGRGFSTSLGYLHADEDHWTQNFTRKPLDNISCSGIDLWETKRPAFGKNGTYGGYIYGARAVDIINNHSANSNKPLFMYLATQNNHAPLEAPAANIDKFNASWFKNQRIYAGMMNFEDELIGNVTAALKKTKMWDNTLLFISTDNGGPEGAANNSPLRGGKFSNWQGGIRGIAMVSGGYLPSDRRGKELNQTIHIADIYATIASVVGINPMDERALKAGLPPIDSIDQWPLIIGQREVSQRNEFMLSTEANGGGLISGDYKILFGTQKPAFWTTLDFPNGTQGEPQSIYCGDIETGGCVFNYKDDPTEHFDIVNKSEYKSVVQQLKERFKELNKTTYDSNYENADPNCCLQIQINMGYWGPWVGYNKSNAAIANMIV